MTRYELLSEHILSLNGILLKCFRVFVTIISDHAKNFKNITIQFYYIITMDVDKGYKEHMCEWL